MAPHTPALVILACLFFFIVYAVHRIKITDETFEPRREKTGFLHMRKQRREAD